MRRTEAGRGHPNVTKTAGQLNPCCCLHPQCGQLHAQGSGGHAALCTRSTSCAAHRNSRRQGGYVTDRGQELARPAANLRTQPELSVCLTLGT